MSQSLDWLTEAALDHKYHLPRRWSDEELRRFAPLFKGRVINVSGWKDIDHFGVRYKSLFTGATEYWVSNYGHGDEKTFGVDNEVFIDLEKELPAGLAGTFDVVFNHTVLEHVYRVQEAFANLCRLSRDVVIVVVPFLQQMHIDPAFGDYWRFTPMALANMYKDNGFTLLHLSYNNQPQTSVYLFAIGSKNPDRWRDTFPKAGQLEFTAKRDLVDGFERYVGCRAIQNPLLFKLRLVAQKAAGVVGLGPLAGGGNGTPER